MSDSIIQISNMNKWFGDFQVLKDINLEVQPKQKIVVCGPSGSGKSTLIRCINRLEEHQEGSIVVDGIELTGNLKNIDNVRKEVGMVFQQFNLFPHLSVKENITLAPIWVRKKSKSEAEEKAMELLERVGIPEQADKFPGQLSGGQQQRLVIARAIAIEPEVLLLDEPTSALDPISTLTIEELINDLKKQFTVVIVTHNMQQAARVSKKTAFFHLGDLIEYNDTDKIFTQPENQKTQDYITGRFG